MSEALGKIRKALKGIDLLGAEAIEMKPGAVVLIVLRAAPTASAQDVSETWESWRLLTEYLRLDGVRAVACMLLPGMSLDAIDITEDARGARTEVETP